MLIEVAGLAMLAVSSPTAPLAVLIVVSCV
jgi:hypothetical protein